MKPLPSWNSSPKQNSSRQLDIIGKLRTTTVPAALIVWVAGLAYSFWFYEMRYFLPASKPVGAATIVADSLPLASVSCLNTSAGLIPLINTGSPTVLNFWNPECPCSRFMERHVRDLLNQYSSKGVRFITVVVGPSDNMSSSTCESMWLSRGFSPQAMPYVIDSDDSISRKFGIWAAPAAVILDGAGRVEYIGAYNVSRYCDNSDTAFAQTALQDLIDRKPIKVRTLPFYGCQITAQSVKPHVL